MGNVVRRISGGDLVVSQRRGIARHTNARRIASSITLRHQTRHRNRVARLKTRGRARLRLRLTIKRRASCCCCNRQGRLTNRQRTIRDRDVVVAITRARRRVVRARVLAARRITRHTKIVTVVHRTGRDRVTTR